MTRRRAVANGHTDVLGHCNWPADRRQSWHPARIEVRCRGGVTACREHGTAVEINSVRNAEAHRRLLHLARTRGCVFSIDTDVHAPGRLDFLGYGAQRALDAEVTTWPADTLLAWTVDSPPVGHESSRYQAATPRPTCECTRSYRPHATPTQGHPGRQIVHRTLREIRMPPALSIDRAPPTECGLAGSRQMLNHPDVHQRIQ